MMKKLILSIAFGLGVAGNLMAMEPVISSGNAGQEPGEAIVASEAEVKSVVTEPMVRITTSDDQEHTISLSVAKKIPVLKNLLEDIDEEHQTMAIPLPNVDSKSFELTKKLLEKHNEDEITENDLKDFKSDYLIKLITAAEYLDLELLKVTLFEVLNRRNLSAAQLDAMGGTLFQQFWLQHPAYRYFFAPRVTENLHFSGGVVSVSPHGDRLAATFPHRNSPLILWSANSPVAEQLPIPRARVYFIAHKIVAPAEEGGIGIWDLDNFEQPPYVLPTIASFSLSTVSSDEKKLITWSPSRSQGIITVWNLENLDEEPWKIDEPVSHVIASARSLIAWDDQTIKIWDFNDRDKEPYELSYKAAFASISADGNTLTAWSYNNGTIRVWDMNQLEKGFHDLEHERVNSVRAGVGVHSNIVVSFSLAKSSIKIWDLNNPHKLVRELRGKRIDGFFMTDDRLMVFSVTKPGYIDIYDLNNLDQTPYAVPLSYNQRQSLQGVEVSADGSTLVTWSRESIQLWKFLLSSNEPSKLNLVQIRFLMWLNGISAAPSSNVILTDEQKAIYQTLSNNLQVLIQDLFPQFRAQLIEQQAAGEEQNPAEEQPVPVRTSRRSRFFDKFKRSKK